MKRKVLLSILAAGTVITAATLSTRNVSADELAYRPVIQRLSEKFNLEEVEIQAVFDAVREERLQEMKDRHKERLQDAVNDGVISEDQMNALLDKHQEMRSEGMKSRGKSNEMRLWMSENGIDHEKLREYMGNEMGSMGRGMKMR